MKAKERTYICIYEHKDGTLKDLVFTGTFHVVYKKACRFCPMDCVLIEINIA